MEVDNRFLSAPLTACVNDGMAHIANYVMFKTIRAKKVFLPTRRFLSIP